LHLDRNKVIEHFVYEIYTYLPHLFFLAFFSRAHLHGRTQTTTSYLHCAVNQWRISKVYPNNAGRTKRAREELQEVAAEIH
jgi:hypothetical protein